MNETPITKTTPKKKKKNTKNLWCSLLDSQSWLHGLKVEKYNMQCLSLDKDF